MILFKRVLLSTIILILLLTNFTFYKFNTISISAMTRQERLKTEYDKRKADIEEKKLQVQEQMNVATLESNTLSVQSKTLSETLNNRKKDIEFIDSQIKKINNLIDQMNKQKADLEKQKSDLTEELKIIVVEIQTESRIPLLQKIFNGSVGQSLEKFFSLKSLNDQAAIVMSKLDNTQFELDLNLTSQNDLKAELDNAKSILNSRQSSLEVLLEKTNGEQSKFEELITSLNNQSEILTNDYQKIGEVYLAEARRITDEEIAENKRKEAEALAKNNNKINTVSNTNKPPKLGCFFETDGLRVANGEFGPATTGAVSQMFHCGHDGVDISNSRGTSLFSISNGTIVQKGAPADNCVGTSCNHGFGNYVIIQYNLQSGQTVYGLYGHMLTSSPFGVGSSVNKGDVIGQMGCTGYTQPYPCGLHLHFMLIADTLDNGIACLYGNAKCYNPLRYIPLGS
jgi:murein DD-endopeptidase MepM/ murein hydrolase activator NlpD